MQPFFLRMITTGNSSYHTFCLAILLSSNMLIYFTDMHGFRKVDRKVGTDVKGKIKELEVIVASIYQTTCTLAITLSLSVLLLPYREELEYVL